METQIFHHAKNIIFKNSSKRNPNPSRYYNYIINLKFQHTLITLTMFLCQTEFHPVFIPSFLFPDRLHCCCIYFHCSYMYNYYNYLEPCALNAEFLHFIPRFNKTSLLCGPLWLKDGLGGEKRPKDRVKTGWLWGKLYNPTKMEKKTYPV